MTYDETLLTDDNYALALVDGAPPPLSPFTDVIISPANIAAEQRMQRARSLPRRRRLELRLELRRLNADLRRENYTELRQRWRSIYDDVAELRAQYDALQAAAAAAPESIDWTEYESLLSALVPAAEQYQAYGPKIRELKPLAQRRNQVARLIEDDSLARQRRKTEKRLLEMMEKEAKIYEQIIVSTWTRLGFCYRYTVDGTEHVDRVAFVETGITVDAIYYKIDTSYKTIFKNWKTNLPRNVYVRDELLSEKTLAELTIACQRQVSGEWSANGAWIIVHRLSSADGLLNHVDFTDVLERFPVKHHDRMPVCVGVAEHRQVQWVNLVDFPHWLIAGHTGSGKSNLINNGLCTLISLQSPERLRLVLIDLKGGIEFDYYNGIPHLYGDIIQAIPDVAAILLEMESLMNSRFERFRGRAKTLEEWNAKNPAQRLSRVLVAFDEVASVMNHGDLTNQIMASLQELTRKGRAVGIHFWLCTQRPEVKAVEGAVKANLAVRISGRMTTTGDSVTVLGHSMAKDLANIPGRMIMQIGPDPVVVQTPLITDADIGSAIAAAMSYEVPPPLDVPQGVGFVNNRWTVERIIDLSLKHLGGNITASKIWEQTDGLSKGQARALVEQVWNMPEVEHDGERYRVHVGKHNQRRLEPIPPDMLESGLES